MVCAHCTIAGFMLFGLKKLSSYYKVLWVLIDYIELLENSQNYIIRSRKNCLYESASLENFLNESRLMENNERLRGFLKAE